MTILNPETGQPAFPSPNDKDLEQGVLDNLQMGEYVIFIKSKEIHDINDLHTPLYTFELEVDDGTEY